MARDTKTSTELQRTGGRSAGVVAAFQEVTDGVMELTRTHLQLARAEAKGELKVYMKLSGLLAFGVGFGLLGFGILNLALIFVAGWLGGGFGAMAAVAGILGVTYVLIGMWVAWSARRGMKSRENGLTETKKEIKRSSQWVKEIRESS